MSIVRRYFELTEGFDAPVDELRTRRRRFGDPLYAVWAARTAPS